jgi:hypothetical protein
MTGLSGVNFSHVEAGVPSVYHRVGWLAELQDELIGVAANSAIPACPMSLRQLAAWHHPI